MFPRFFGLKISDKNMTSNRLDIDLSLVSDCSNYSYSNYDRKILEILEKIDKNLVDQNESELNYKTKDMLNNADESSISKSKPNKIYTCDLCGRTFDRHNPYWYHIYRSKKLCISKENVFAELKNLKDKLQYKDKRLKEFEEENQRLTTQLEFAKSVLKR